MRKAILISGRGSNLKALVDSCPDQDFFVYSNKPNCPGLKWAVRRGLPCKVIDFKALKAWENLAEELNLLSVSHVYLLGFMKIIPADFLDKVKGQIVNIHPSVLPDFPGLHALEKSIEEKKAVGCTLHIVTAGVDEGPVIFQKKINLNEKMFTLKEETERVHLGEQDIVHRYFRATSGFMSFKESCLERN